MTNLKNITFDNCNLMVYVKLAESKIYEPIQSLKTLTIAPNLMYAALYPFEKLDLLKSWLDSQEENCKKYKVSFQIRSAKDRKKIFHEIKS